MEYSLKFVADAGEAEKSLDSFLENLRKNELQTEKVSQAQRQLAELRKELAAQEKRERKAAFDALSIDERLNKLYAQRADLAERIAKAGQESQSPEQELRLTALKVARGATNEQIRPLEQQRDLEQAKAAAIQEQEQAARRIAEAREAEVARQREAQEAASNQRKQESAASEAAAAKAKAERQAELDAQAEAVALQRRLSGFQRELAEGARAARDKTFDQLPLEERLNQLYQRRLELSRLLARAQGNELRSTILKVGQQRNEREITGLESQRPAGFLARLTKGLGSGAKILGEASGLGAFVKGFSGLAAALFAIQKGKEIVNYGGRVADEAEKRNISPEALQSFEFAAAQKGASPELISNALSKNEVSIARAQGGNKEDISAFKRFNVSLEDLKGLKPEEIFLKISQAIAGTEPSARQSADIIRLLGREASDLLPAFRDGFGAAAQHAKDAGLVIENDLIGKLDDIGDTFAEVGAKFRNFFAAPVALFGGIAAKTFKTITDGVQYTGVLIGTFLGSLSAGEGYFGAGERTFEALEKLKDQVGPKHGDKKLGVNLEDQDLAKLKKQLADLGRATPLASKDPLFYTLNSEEKIRRLSEELVDLKKKLDDLRAKNIEAFGDVVFDSLSTEEKINQLTAIRLELLRKIRSERDPIKREELVGHDLEAEKNLQSLQRESPLAFDTAKNDLIAQLNALRNAIQNAKNKTQQDDLISQSQTLQERLSNLEKGASQVKQSDNKPLVDQLTRIGLFTGKPDNTMLTLARQQVALLGAVARNTGPIPDLPNRL